MWEFLEGGESKGELLCSVFINLISPEFFALVSLSSTIKLIVERTIGHQQIYFEKPIILLD